MISQLLEAVAVSRHILYILARQIHFLEVRRIFEILLHWVACNVPHASRYKVEQLSISKQVTESWLVSAPKAVIKDPSYEVLLQCLINGDGIQYSGFRHVDKLLC